MTRKKAILSLSAILMAAAVFVTGPEFGGGSAKAEENLPAGVETTSKPKVTPTPNPYAESKLDIRTSGKYTYSIFSDADKLISILSVDDAGDYVEFPEKIDGYTVIGIGQTKNYPSDISLEYWQYRNKTMDTSIPLNVFNGQEAAVKGIAFPKTLRFIGHRAFYHCSAIEEIEFAKAKDTLTIDRSAFEGCTSIKQLDLPANAEPARDSFCNCGTIDTVTMKCGEKLLEADVFYNTQIKDIYLSGKHKFFVLNHVRGDVDTLHVGKGIGEVQVFKPYGDEDGEPDDDYYAPDKESDEIDGCFYRRIIVEDKNTSLTGFSADWCRNQKLGYLYTVPKAASISWARHHALNYQVKVTKAPGKVKKKKKNVYTWKKTKTTIKKYVYDEIDSTWDIRKKNVKTVYKVYGKKKKKGTYKLIKTTTKNKIKTKYRYLKVKTKIWE